MKLSDILEAYGRGGISEHPFTVELERQDPTSEEGDYYMVDVSGVVTITPDAFSTGDSPTDYDVDVTEAIDKRTGKPIPIKALTADEYEWVQDKAISQVTRNL